MLAAQVAEARRWHWATAGPVLIEGASGLNSGFVNGAFEVVERPHNEPPIYRRADGRDWWLYVSSTGMWAVGDEEDKDALEEDKVERKTSSACWAHSVEAAEGRLPHEVGAAWKVKDRFWKLTEQQLRVLHGEEAEVAIAEVWVYAYPPACTHMNAGMPALCHRSSAQPMAARSIVGDL